MKKVVLLALLFIPGLCALRAQAPDTGRIGSLVRAGCYLLYKPGSYKVDLDSAMGYFNQALALSRSLHADSLMNVVLALKGSCYLEGSELAPGVACFQEVTHYYHQKGIQHEEAKAWERLGDCIPIAYPAFVDKKLDCYNQAKVIFRKLHDLFAETKVLKDIADVHLNQNKADLAEKELLEVLDNYKKLHYRFLFPTYDLLRAVYAVKGDLARQVICVDEMIRSMESFDHDSIQYKDYFYMRAAETYAHVGLYDRSLYYCRKGSLINTDQNQLTLYYDLFTMIVEDLVHKGDAKEAYAFLIKNSRQYPPIDLVQKEYIAYYSGLCNTALQHYPAAEKNFLLMLALTDSIRKDQQVIHFRQTVTPDRYLTMGNFYFITHDYAKAEFYRQKIVIHPGDAFSLDFRRQLEMFRSQLDSALGRYASALQHRELYEHFNDSLNNVAKLIQIQELEIKYETAQKDKDIQTQAGNILLLTRQAQLQKSEAEKSRTIRNLMIGSLFILLLLVGVVYNRYRLKQRNNRLLERQKLAITTQNQHLEKLLGENEWLLREVHHRVKNNLQVIMSLLNSQSTYLQDAAAISAVMDSRHRVQAMSLIHQKLYRSNVLSTIDMPEYIGDLMDYLAFSLQQEHPVFVQRNIEMISLDVSQAIPLGLIINEVVTNAYKYAFPHTEMDMISIHLVSGGEGAVVLSIADNGKGLPPDLDLESINSFGMILIHGLVEDLNGSLTLSSAGGTAYTIRFKLRGGGSPGPGNRS